MDDIVRVVADRTGLTDDQARQAVDTVVSVLKGRLPEPARSMVGQVVGGPEAAPGEEAVPGEGGCRGPGEAGSGHGGREEHLQPVIRCPRP